MNIPARRVFHARYVAVALTALLGTLVSIGAFLLVRSWEQRVAEIDFQSKAKSFLEVINADLNDASTLLYTLGAYVDTTEHAVSQRQFERFSQVLHARVVGLRDIGWAPRVTRAQRPGFEREARAAGIGPDYRIVERDAQRTLVTAGDRPAYHAILYVETGAIKGALKRSVLGFDVSSEPVRAAAIARAVRTGQPAATPPLRLLTVKGRIGGVMGFMPVGESRGQHSDTKRPTGVVFGIFETAAMIENIVAKKTLVSGLNLYLFNPSGSPGHRLIYWRSSLPEERQAPAERAVLAATHWQATVSMIDQRWGAIITPTTALRSQNGYWPAVTTLVVGMTMTAMIIAYLLISLRRTIYLEGLTASLRGATEDLHRNVEQIAHMARHDALTGLPNRVLFRERIDEAVARHRRDAPFAIFYLDLDHFKAVNDTLGHSAGDRLLCIVAARIAGCLREVDTIARLGGDEFAIIVVDKASPEILAQVAERLISEVGKPYVIDEHTVVVGVTVGIATATPDGATAESLLKEADLALYEAKAAGRGTYRFFETRLRLQIEAKRTLERELRRGLERGEFEVYYQPIMNLAQNRVAALEALVRWNHPEHGLLEPDRFLAVAEECGLTVPLGSWVLRTACGQAADWPEPVKVAVNISPLQLKSDDVAASVLQCLTRSGLPAQRLDIEITEAAVLQESATTLAAIEDLRAMGVAVAFDDFGTGFSSLSSLLRFPFDKLKIDRSFLLDTSHSAAAIVRAIVGLGGNLGLVTTGEGVETREQLADLRRFGCIEAQGHFFSPARPNSDVPRLLRELNANARSAIGMIGV